MKFFDCLIHEYLKKRDYSNSEAPFKRDRDSAAKSSIRNKRAYLFRVKAKSFIHDFMLLFSDFKERLTDGYCFENQSRMDARQLKVHRDKYLAIYQGIMFTMENLCFKSQLQVCQ